MVDEYRGSGDNVYDGPQTEDDYLRWVIGEYGDVVRSFPPASVVCFEGDEVHEYVVVKYCLVGDKSTVGIIDMVEQGKLAYEDFWEVCRDICPEHELPRLRYLYNLNGEEFAKKTREIVL